MCVSEGVSVCQAVIATTQRHPSEISAGRNDEGGKCRLKRAMSERKKGSASMKNDVPVRAPDRAVVPLTLPELRKFTMMV